MYYRYLALILTTLWSAPLWADANLPPPPMDDSPMETTAPKWNRLRPAEGESAIPLFDKNSWVRSWDISYYRPQDTDNRAIDLYDFRIGRARHILKNLGLYHEFNLTVTNGVTISSATGNEPKDTDRFGVGTSIGLRWHAIRRENWSLFVDAGFGVLLTTEAFPAGGTRYNAFSRWGYGITRRINHEVHLSVGVRETHLSNGKGFVDNNPSYNGDGFHVGVIRKY